MEKMINSNYNEDSERKRILYQSKFYSLLGVPEEDIMSNIKAGKVAWFDPCFDDLKFIVAERNEFIMNPIDVSKGIFKCNKCGSMETFSYTKQVRSSDEPMAVFVTCAEPKCGQSWREA